MRTASTTRRSSGTLLATAGRNRTPLVYAEPTNTRPHGPMRNAASWLSGRVARSVSGVSVRFHSFRLLEGSLARSACAYAGENVFLDVALSWTCGPPSACPVQLRQEAAPSSYNYRRLLSHFWRLIVTQRHATAAVHRRGRCGDRAHRAWSWAPSWWSQRLSGAIDVPGWTSVIIALLVLLGGLYIAVAVVAEYVGQAVRNTVGRPVYVRVDPPEARALHVLSRSWWRRRPARQARRQAAGEPAEAGEPGGAEGVDRAGPAR